MSGAEPLAGCHSVHEQAAKGDPDGFATLSAWHRERARSGVEPAQIALARAADYARLTAIARGAHDDWLTLMIALDDYATALRSGGLVELADNAQAEAVTLAEFMADDGDEDVAAAIAACGSAITPAALNIARAMRDILKGKLEC